MIDFKKILAPRATHRPVHKAQYLRFDYSKLEYFRKEKIRWFIKYINVVNDRCWLGGGALQTLVNQDLVVNDYDLFFKDQDTRDVVKNKLLDQGFHIAFLCPKGELITMKMANPTPGLVMLHGNEIKVQLISKRYYDSMEDAIATFDFTASMWITDGITVTTTRAAIRDTVKQQLNFNIIEYPVATLKRVTKYLSNKGFTIDGNALSVFVQTVNQMELDENNLALYVD